MENENELELNLKSACTVIRINAQTRGDKNDPSLSSFSEIGRLIQEEKYDELFNKSEWTGCLEIATHYPLFMTDMAIQKISKYFPEIIKELIDFQKLVGKFKKVAENIKKDGYSDDPTNHGPRIGCCKSNFALYEKIIPRLEYEG